MVGAVALSVVGGVAWAAIPSDDGKIYACYGNGVVMLQGLQPVLIPVSGTATIKFAATAAANSIVNAAWFA